MTNAVAIIPARIGSKRIPKKNLREFFGKPMIQYSIEAAKNSGLFSRIIVSTDSEDLAEMAMGLGASAPFLRPPHLADDFSPLAEVLLHALDWLQKNELEAYDVCCCILATAPFIEIDDLKSGYNLLLQTKASSVIPVTSFGFPILRAFKKSHDNHLEMFWPEHEMTRSNDLLEAYHDAGQFYWLKTQTFVKEKKIFSKDSRAIILPRYRVQDIDTLEDWQRAEKLFQTLHTSKGEA